jgi:AcrR family transcriptional regulator
VRSKLKSEDRQAELVAAALHLAATQSPSEITTGDLAKVIGITQGGVFKHFDSKEGIWLAVVDWAHQVLMLQLRQVAKGENQTALQSLRAVFMAHIPNPTPLKDKVQLLMTDYRQLLAGLLAQAHKEGAIAPEVDAQAAGVLFIGAIQGLVMQSLMTGSLEKIKQQAKTVFSIYEAGLLVSAQPKVRKLK